MSSDQHHGGGDGVPRAINPDDDTAQIVVMTRPRLETLVRQLCAQRGEPPPLAAALAAIPIDDLIALVRRLRVSSPR